MRYLRDYLKSVNSHTFFFFPFFFLSILLLLSIYDKNCHWLCSSKNGLDLRLVHVAVCGTYFKCPLHRYKYTKHFTFSNYLLLLALYVIQWSIFSQYSHLFSFVWLGFYYGMLFKIVYAIYMLLISSELAEEAARNSENKMCLAQSSSQIGLTTHKR